MKNYFTLILLLISGLAFGQFGSQELIFPSTLLPTSIQTGDINNDGNLDVVVAFAEQSRIVWYENIDGTGTFDLEKIVSRSIDLPQSITLTDIDGDGDLDVVSASSGDHSIAWFENEDGLGSFGPKLLISTNAINAEFVVTEDLDGDGNMDVLSASSGDNKVAWYPNTDGTGSFPDEIIISNSVAGVKSVFIADINGDNFPDVLAAANLSGVISWFENINGTGNFGVQTDISTDAEGAQSITAADFDNDGDIDVAVAIYKQWVAKKVVWYENTNSLGLFSDEITIKDPYDNVLDIISADVDGDGDVDLVSSSTSHYAYWMKNDGNGAFGAGTLSVNTSNHSVAVGDLNNDTYIDILVGFDIHSNLRWFENNETNINLLETVLAFTPENVHGVAAGDFNDDNKMDFVSASGTWEDNLVWYEGSNDEVLTPNIIDGSGTFGPGYNNDLFSMDMDADGDLDILFGSTDGLGWHENENGQGEFSTAVFLPGTSSMDSPHPVDVDNDGDMDLIARSAGSNDIIGWLENEAGIFSSLNIVEQNAFGQINFITSADIDADGFMDIVTGTSSQEIVWYKNDNGSGFNLGEILLLGVRFIDEFSVVDVDGDGDLDVVAFDNPFNTADPKPIKWYENIDGLGTFNDGYVITEMPNLGRRVLSDDVDNDGDFDIIAAGSTEIYYLENLNNTGTFSPPVVISDDYAGINDITLKDIDYDGDNDILISSNGDDNLTIHRNHHISSKVKVVVFNDENENGTLDLNENSLLNQEATIDPGAITSWTNSQGELNFIVTNNEYLITSEAQPNWLASTPSSATIDFSAGVIDTCLFFGLSPETDVFETDIHLTSAATRCGFTVPFWLTTINTGTMTYQGVTQLKIDTSCTFVNSVPMPDSIENNEYFWFNDDLSPSYSNQIYLNIEMPGVDLIGTSILFESKSTAFDVDGNEVATDEFEYLQQINCAYDPNDKLVDIPIPNVNNYTFFDDTLVYTIRFQNTGTDTAFNVRIQDDLDMNLDLNTFRVLTASHNYSVTLDDFGTVVFYFDNILLPDSTTNEIASHGFITFEIEPKENLAEGTEILNEADIYFDFNPPINTNTVVNIMVSEFPLTFTFQSPSCFDAEDGSIVLSNSEEGFTYTWDNGTMGPELANIGSGTYLLTVFSSNGEIVSDSAFVLTSPSELLVSGASSLPEIGSNMNGSAFASVSGGSPPYSFVWNTNPSQTDSIATNLSAGEYIVTITDAEGCSVTESVTVEMLTSNSTPQDMENLLFEVSPNPSTGFLDISLKIDNEKNWNLVLFNINGTVIHQFDSNKAQLNQEKFRIEGLSSGVYQLALYYKEKVISKEIIVLD